MHLITLSDSHTHSVGLLGRGINPTQRPVSYNTQFSQETGINDPGGIRTSNPSKRATAELHLIPRGHGDWTVNKILIKCASDYVLGSLLLLHLLPFNEPNLQSMYFYFLFVQISVLEYHPTHCCHICQM